MSGRGWHRSLLVLTVEQEDCLQLEPMGCGSLGLVVQFLEPTEVCLPAVDCWDGPDGEPIVHHGYTLTSKILFKDVIETINKYAFIKNE